MERDRTAAAPRPPPRRRLQHEVIRATLNSSFMPCWLGSSRGCGGPLNVSAPCLPLPVLPFHFWLNHQITACLHSQVLRFLLRQAGGRPRLSLSFLHLGFGCIWRQTPEKATNRSSLLSLILSSTLESQASSFPSHAMRISGEHRQESACRCIFLFFFYAACLFI